MKTLRKFLGNRVCWAAVVAVFAAAVVVLVCNEVPEYCGEGNKLNPATQFCFNNKTYDKCGGAEYDPTSQICEGATLKTKCAGGESFYNPATEFCRNGSAYEKCGGGVYNPDSQICTGDALRTKCGDGYFSPVSEFCFNESVYPKCGGNIYIPTAQTCENGVLLAKCGDKDYNPASHFCAVGQVYPKCGGVGGVEYDPSFQQCEGNILKSKCGAEFFNPASQFCTNDKVYSKCGGKEYDPATQACDAGSVKTRCGSDVYDSTSAFCLNNTIYQKCRGAVYEPANQKCENGIVKEKCGSEFYNTETEFCYMNAVYQKCNGKVYDPAAEECKEISMVFVQGGQFTMGCTDSSGCKESYEYKYNTPSHKVTLGSFYIGRYEISQKQWVEVMGYNPSETQGEDLPVTNVSWDTIQVFIRKLNITTGKSYRLPTEAEWEYAARGGINSKGYTYAGSDNIDDVAWYGDNNYIQTYPYYFPRIIGTKQPNELGIYDMSGNVAEWCHDDIRDYNAGSQTNPMGSTTTDYRAFRGGSYQGTTNRNGSCYSSGTVEVHCRVYTRFRNNSGNDPSREDRRASRYRDLGFRLAHSP